jgi:hypothetical protein
MQKIIHSSLYSFCWLKGFFELPTAEGNSKARTVNGVTRTVVARVDSNIIDFSAKQVEAL